MDYNYQVKIINGMAVQSDTDIRIDCPFCFHKNTFTLKNISGKIMWNCFHASCNIKGSIKRDMSPEELKNFLSLERSLPNQMKWSAPHYFTSVHSNARALNYLKNNNCFDAMQKGFAKIMYDPKKDRVVFLIRESNEVVNGIGRAITSDNYPKWFIYGKNTKPFVCGNHKDAILVEDCASACAVSDVITGIALLGTSLKDDYIPHLKKYNKVFVALDRDATTKSFDIANKLCYTVDSVQVMVLEDDLKYFNSNDIRKLIYETKNKTQASQEEVRQESIERPTH